MKYLHVGRVSERFFVPEKYRLRGGSHRRRALEKMRARFVHVERILHQIMQIDEREGKKMIDHFAGVYWDDNDTDTVACASHEFGGKGYKMLFNAASDRTAAELYMDVIHEFTHVATNLVNHGQRFTWHLEARAAKYITAATTNPDIYPTPRRTA